MFSEQIEELKRGGRWVLIVGLGVSGVESARFLVRRGVRVRVVDRQSEEVFRARSKYGVAVDELRALGVDVVLGVDGERIAPLLGDVGLAVLSPGVPLESAVVATITRVGVPYVSELELGVQLHGGRSVVVTGSNGKSTTVSLIHHIVRSAGIRSFLCGNVGTPVIANQELLSEDDGNRSLLVVEASSYQLEACTVLKPAVSVFLNISENHLERHGTLERYAAAKAKVFRVQTSSDLVVANGDDPVVRRLAASARATVALFGRCSEADLAKGSATWAQIRSGSSVATGVTGSSGASSILLSLNGEREEYDTSGGALLGMHNRYNMAAAILATRRLGVTPDAVQAALRSFTPLEHRLEVCLNDGSRVVINDSKSTTVAATVAALTTVTEHFEGRPLSLLIGGLSKAGSWEPVLSVCQRVRGRLLPVVCFGKDGPLLASHCRAAGLPCEVVETVREALQAGLKAIDGGGVVLLSPGCASFDQFTDFEHRGAEFKRYVADADLTHQR
jgi:UDP-N-acetylmuramoylalanine--D-glutamate ligase